MQWLHCLTRMRIFRRFQAQLSSPRNHKIDRNRDLIYLGVVARVHIFNFRLLNWPITRFRPSINYNWASITELFNSRDGPTPEITDLQNWCFKKKYFFKKTLFQSQILLWRTYKFRTIFSKLVKLLNNNIIEWWL